MTAALTPAALQRRPTYALARLAAASRRRCAQHLATVGLGQHQHAILCCLDEFGPQMQKDTAARLGIDSGDIVAFVDDLQSAGLVERRRDERDRRRQILTLTSAGQQALTEAERQLDQATQETFRPLTEAEQAQLHQLIGRVLAHDESGSWPTASR